MSCIGALKKNQKSEFQFGKREGKVDAKEVIGGKHLKDQSGSERQNVFCLSAILEFGEHPQRGSRVCVLEQKRGRDTWIQAESKSLMRQYTSQEEETD